MPCASIIICANTGQGRFADDVPATCAECGRGIVHRPHVPKDLVKLCWDCGVERVQIQAAKGKPFRPAITPETAADLRLYFAKGGRA